MKKVSNLHLKPIPFLGKLGTPRVQIPIWTPQLIATPPAITVLPPHPTTMPTAVIAFFLGILSCQTLTDLPDTSYLLLLSPFILILFRLPRPFPLLAWWIIGLFYASWRADLILNQQLLSDFDGKNQIIQGLIIDIPQLRDAAQDHWKFHFIPTSPVFKQQSTGFPPKIVLNWRNPPRTLQPGQHWQLTVRLKPPKSSLNPDIFDWSQWLFQNRIRATGYVHNASNSQLLAPPPYSLSYLFSQINNLRFHLAHDILHTLKKDSPNAGILIGLTVGEKQWITPEQWSILKNTGTIHLLTISGLHIAFIAALGFILAHRLWGFWREAPLWLPARHFATLISLLCALSYAVLAGLTVPTQRSLIMLLAALFAFSFNRQLFSFQILLLSLLGVLLFDPLAVLGISFWLSFGAVAIIVYAVATFRKPGVTQKYQKSILRYPLLDLKTRIKEIYHLFRDRKFSTLRSLVSYTIQIGVLKIRGFLYLQWVITLLLSPLLAVIYGYIPPSSLLTNLIAIPWITFLTIPFLFIGLALLNISLLIHAFQILMSLTLVINLTLSLWLSDCRKNLLINSLYSSLGLLLASQALRPSFIAITEQTGRNLLIDLDWLLTGFWYFLQLFTEHPKPYFPPFLSLITATFLILSILLLLLPKFPGKWLGFTGFLLLVPSSSPPSGTVQLTLLDVGQGLSAVVRTAHYTLLYDTGPQFTATSDAGNTIILPFLQRHGIRRLDKLILSHFDDDHEGGLKSLIQSPGYVREIMAARPYPSLTISSCRAGQYWNWDGVQFELLYPPEHFPYSRYSLYSRPNNLACVLKVTTGQHSILFPGDIEKIVEYRLVNSLGKQLQSDILIVPHHGSKHSSTSKFLSQVKPRFALFSAGYRNRFRHPHPDTVARYQQHQVRTFNTAEVGAITFRLTPDRLEGPLFPRRYYWHK